ncbi:hypothetical protein XBKB1_700026 [Xenorhabdus bovienii str. kraussei Becker Underwood]|uniref:Uncharacterized protein n=1 Tax=Xenorhabdus bovienii str. kraussei Becker Underwood TaxID=1398204 RepID=A0A077Q0H1_XENBV|nr:hypothetical protein XBKB1_700026 [Xenorhabdus bovienii str. kraussei Becker Underwood]
MLLIAFNEGIGRARSGNETVIKLHPWNRHFWGFFGGTRIELTYKIIFL